MNIQIELISESDLADESFNIVIDGLKPREIYRVEMFLSDYVSYSERFCSVLPAIKIESQFVFFY